MASQSDPNTPQRQVPLEIQYDEQHIENNFQQTSKQVIIFSYLLVEVTWERHS